ncbi:EAL and HDOD domain-containing protein [Ampullimonas aquatilis]|uniref:EAL and HDOD domain-containing protein n=1 Tax=Ampullimonas aquatilis TaxID=1341549 RepID=UPI003C728E50
MNNAWEVIANEQSVDPEVEVPKVGQTTLIKRQPIFNDKFTLVGYELDFRNYSHHPHGEAAIIKTNGNSMVTLFDSLSAVSIDALLGNALAFVACEPEDIVPDFEDYVSPDRVVIDLALPPDYDKEDYDVLKEQIIALKNRGFQLAINQYALEKPFLELLRYTQYLKIDTRSLPEAKLVALPKKLAVLPNLKMVATHIASPDQFKLMGAAGYKAFQGPFYAQPITSTARAIESAQQNILIMIRLVQKQADLTEIEEKIKRDPALSFNLLRYVNSAAFGAAAEITSYQRALQILGYQKLMRWLSIRLIAASKHPANVLLLRASLTRGRMMELLAHEEQCKTNPEQAFLTGLFSLLDKILGVPMLDALAGIHLPDDVNNALISRAGPLGVSLKLAEYCELPTTEQGAYPPSDEKLMQLVADSHLKAMAWAEEAIK